MRQALRPADKQGALFKVIVTPFKPSPGHCEGFFCPLYSCNILILKRFEFAAAMAVGSRRIAVQRCPSATLWRSPRRMLLARNINGDLPDARTRLARFPRRPRRPPGRAAPARAAAGRPRPRPHVGRALRTAVLQL